MSDVLIGLLAVAVFFAATALFAAAMIRADVKDQAAYDRWFERFMGDRRA